MSQREEARALLASLLDEVQRLRAAIARGEAAPADLTPALLRAAVFYPVFPNQPSPVPAWLDELDAIAGRDGDIETRALVAVRTAIVRMRLNDLDGASATLDSIDLPSATIRVRFWATVMKARIAIRHGRVDPASTLLDDARAFEPSDEDWLAPLGAVARGELLLERGDVEDAEEIYLAVLPRLAPEMFEERINALQALGFIYVTLADARSAVRYLDNARELLLGAAVWPDAIQMSLVVGALLIPLGNAARAAAIFTEALELCATSAESQFEPMLRVMLARALRAEGDSEGAIASTLAAAAIFAEHGQALGYVGMIIMLSEIYLERNDSVQAYKTLLTGVSIAKRLGLPRGERALRSRIERLRQIVLGPRRFDAMVAELLRKAKNAGEGPAADA